MKQALLVLIAAGLILAACAPGFDSPESAAVDYLMTQGKQDLLVDDATLVTLDQGAVGAFHPVLLHFTATRGAGKERCLYVYNVEQRGLNRWRSNGGGGLCREQDHPSPAISASGGWSAGSKPADPGLSTLSGLVLDETITNVQVTWDDGLVQDLPVVSGSYFAAREGKFNMKSLRASDDSGQVIYSQ